MAQGRSTKIVSVIRWIRTSRLSIKNSLWLCGQVFKPPAKSRRVKNLYFDAHKSQNMRLLYKNVQWFRGGLVLKARGLLCHSTLGLSVIKKKKNREILRATVRRNPETGGSVSGRCSSRRPSLGGSTTFTSPASSRYSRQTSFHVLRSGLQFSSPMVYEPCDCPAVALRTLQEPSRAPFRGTSLMRNTHPPRITIGP